MSRPILWLCSLFFGACVIIRRSLYTIGFKKSLHLPILTISVGNIVAGGTGKTPLAIYLAKLFADQAVAVVLRSYRAKAVAPVKLSRSETDDPKIVGDEACIIARHVPAAAIWVAKKKSKAALQAYKEGAQVIIIDDGMQHLAIKSDFHVVVIDAENPFGYGYLLPRGMLREPLSGLKRADLIVINCRQMVLDTIQIEEKIRSYTQAPIVKATLKIDGVFDLHEQRQELLQGTKVALFCGIGKPQQFIHSVETLELDVVGTLFTKDHAAIPLEKLECFAKQMKQAGARCLLCTEKDRVKIWQLPRCALPIYWLRIQSEFDATAIITRFKRSATKLATGQDS